MLRRYLSGESAETIGRELNRSPASVERALRRLVRNIAGQAIGRAGSSLPAVLGPTLRARFAGAMSGFLTELQRTRQQADQAALDELCRSTDRLMRSIARLRIELGRKARNGGS